MKAAIVCGAGIVSGKEVMALELGEGLREKGCSVFYVTSLWGDGDFAARLRSHKFPFSRMRIGFISATLTADNLWMTVDQMMRWPKLLYDYNQFLLRERPDYVIHTNWHHVLLLLPFLRQERDIFWLHETRAQQTSVCAPIFNIVASHTLFRSRVECGCPGPAWHRHCRYEDPCYSQRNKGSGAERFD